MHALEGYVQIHMVHALIAFSTCARIYGLNERQRLVRPRLRCTFSQKYLLLSSKCSCVNMF